MRSITREFMRIDWIAIAAALAVAAPALAADIRVNDVGGPKLDETTRDTQYLNNATTALDEATARNANDIYPRRKPRIEHRIIMKDSGPTHVFILPGTPAEELQNPLP